MKKDNIILLIVIIVFLITISFNYKEGIRDPITYSGSSNYSNHCSTREECIPEKIIVKEKCNCEICKVPEPCKEIKISPPEKIDCPVQEPCPIQSPCPSCPASIENIVSYKNTCDFDYLSLQKGKNIPDSFKILMTSYQEMINSITAEEGEDPANPSEKQMEKRGLIQISAIINLRFILMFLKYINDDKTDDTLNFLKGPVCLSAPFLNIEEMDYLNTFIPSIIKPLRKDKMFEQILNKLNSYINDSVGNLCNENNFNCKL